MPSVQRGRAAGSRAKPMALALALFRCSRALILDIQANCERHVYELLRRAWVSTKIRLRVGAVYVQVNAPVLDSYTNAAPSASMRWIHIRDVARLPTVDSPRRIRGVSPTAFLLFFLARLAKFPFCAGIIPLLPTAVCTDLLAKQL